MKSKYCEIIKEQIINHPKYIGLEDILDTLVDDVYEHAQVVLNSVEDEAIINSYLEKVIRTSLITVPKRLNIASRKTSKGSDILNQIKNQTPKTIVEEVREQEPSTDNSFDISEEESEYTNTIETFETTNLIDEDIETETVNELEENEVLVYSESEDIEDEEATIVDSEPDTYDKNLVDLMINGVPEDNVVTNESIDASFEEFNTEINIDETQEIIDETSFDIEEPVLEIESETEPETEQEIENDNLVDELDELDFLEIDTETANEGSKDSAENDTDILAEDIVSIETIDNEEIVSEDINNLDTIDFYEENTEETLIDTSIDELQEVDAIDNFEDLNSVEYTPSEDIIDENAPDNHDNEYSQPDFSCFSFIANNLEIDNEDFNIKLKELDKKYPDLMILDIFELRYKQNLSLDIIADKLGTNEELIYEALGELEDIVEA